MASIHFFCREVTRMSLSFGSIEARVLQLTMLCNMVKQSDKW
uniref:Uncharacterized protein n=1 Tax=Picea sitchensis TaxID=3332 RepID=D5ACR1_PICSI|nr:unknown [Picea sitchensis]